MFTGITRGTYEVSQVRREPGLLTYAVKLDAPLVAGLETGASVSIDGVCQTVVAIDGVEVTFDAIQETLDLTTLGALEVGQRVAVERSSRVGDEVGGHDVAGHVIGTGEIAEVRSEGHVCDLRVAVPAAWMRYILPKGFIAVDGSSLTVGAVDPSGCFDLHLIPETLRLTNLGARKPGDRVNIELDARTVAIVDTVERVLADRFAGQGASGA
jgi:riboflavin synthase